jgi:hypothetical protein
LKAPAKSENERMAQPMPGEKRAAAGERAERGADAEVEEQQLHQRRRVAEELDVALHHRPNERRAYPLQPGAEHANDDAQNDADDRDVEGRPQTEEEAIAVVDVVEDREVQPVGVVEPAEEIRHPRHAVAPSARHEG